MPHRQGEQPGEEHAEAASNILRAAGETVWRIGTVRSRRAGEDQTFIA